MATCCEHTILHSFYLRFERPREGLYRIFLSFTIGLISNMFRLAFTMIKLQHVRGQVFEVDTQMLARLDQLERHPILYERKSTAVEIQATDSSMNTVETIDAYLLTNFKDEMKSLTTLENYETSEHQAYILPALRVNSTPVAEFVKKKGK